MSRVGGTTEAGEEANMGGIQRTGFLAQFRVLDVTDYRGLLAGHMLAQLGADVVQMEPPGGCDGRLQPPYCPTWSEGQNSFYWAAYASGKRSIVCDPTTDPELWRQLVRSADILLDSTAPSDGRPDWLDPMAVATLNPQLVHVSITPFGLTGPKKDWLDSELTLWAAGGPLLLTRDLEGRPLRISVPQAYLHGAATAAGSALTAHAERLGSGIGQHVDLSILQTLPQCTLAAVLAEPIGHTNFVPRPGASSSSGKAGPMDLGGIGSLIRRSKWPVADGYAEMYLATGAATGPSSNLLFAWMVKEGALPERFHGWDWTTLNDRFDSGEITWDMIEEARDHVSAFLLQFRKSDLMQIALDKGIRIAPIETIADLLVSKQFVARGFLTDVAGAQGRYTLPWSFIGEIPGAFSNPIPAPALDADREQILEEWSKGSPPTNIQAKPAGQPLDGLKVLDLAWVVAGPLIGRNFADYGATVIRVESSKRVETARLMGPFPGGEYDVERCGLYDTCNTGKLGLSLDLSRPEARDIVRSLARWADVVVESFTPGQMARWGLSYEELSKDNPGLIMVSTSLTGQTGPFARYSGYGGHGSAIAGFQNIVGRTDAAPVGPHGPYTDFVTPRFGVPATLAALDHRRRTGQGCWLDISQTEAGVQFLAAQIAETSVTGRVQGAMGNRDLAMAPHGVFRTDGDDEWIAIAVQSDAQWDSLASLADINDPAWVTVEGRKRDEDALEICIERWTSIQDGGTLEKTLQSCGIPAHRLVSIEDFAEDPQIKARKHIIKLQHSLSGISAIEASPFILQRTPAQYHRPAPYFGRDNMEVLRDILGYDSETIDALQQSGILT
jgi:crotonobetainyl-CoA:carnitine CoA-transferase CaiB-like acyl-CoA transferase